MVSSTAVVVGVWGGGSCGVGSESEVDEVTDGAGATLTGVGSSSADEETDGEDGEYREDEDEEDEDGEATEEVVVGSVALGWKQRLLSFRLCLREGCWATGAAEGTSESAALIARA